MSGAAPSSSCGAGAVACLRETLVLGRTGETGGAIRSTLSVARRATRLLLVEDLDLTDPGTTSLPGLIGAARVLDTVALLGMQRPDRTGAAGRQPVRTGRRGHRRPLPDNHFRRITRLAPVSAAWQTAAHDRSSGRASEQVVAAATTS